MNGEDLALYQQAQALANSGQLSAAHQIFCNLRQRNTDIEILFGIATTTANPVEARQMIDMIRNLQPYHPQLSQLEALHNQKIQGAYTADPIGPVLLCPYCRQQTPARVKSKISVGGWIWFAACFLFSLGCFFALVPITQVQAMENTAWFFLFLSAVGFLIRRRLYTCGSCGAKIADVH